VANGPNICQMLLVCVNSDFGRFQALVTTSVDGSAQNSA